MIDHFERRIVCFERAAGRAGDIGVLHKTTGKRLNILVAHEMGKRGIFRITSESGLGYSPGNGGDSAMGAGKQVIGGHIAFEWREKGDALAFLLFVFSQMTSVRRSPI